MIVPCPVKLGGTTFCAAKTTRFHYKLCVRLIIEEYVRYQTYLKWFIFDFATYVTKDMLSNMCPHVSKDIVLSAEQAHDLGIAL